MKIVFPNNPTTGDTFQTGSTPEYTWNGSYWDTEKSIDTVKAENIVVDRALSTDSPILTASLATTSSLNISASYAVTSSHLPSTVYVSQSISSSYTDTVSFTDFTAAMVSDEVEVTLVEGIATVFYSNTNLKFLVKNISASNYSYTYNGNLRQANTDNNRINNLPSTNTVTAGSTQRLIVPNVGLPENDAVIEEGNIKIVQDGKAWCFHVKALHDKEVSLNIITAERIKDY